MTTIRIHPEAREEIDAAWRFYTRRDPAVGRRFMAAALQLLERVQEALRQFPEHGLLAMPIGEQTLFFAVRRAVMPGPFPMCSSTTSGKAFPLSLPWLTASGGPATGRTARDLRRGARQPPVSCKEACRRVTPRNAARSQAAGRVRCAYQ